MTALLVSQQADREEYRLNETLAVLGREAKCDIVLEGSGVSRRHASIVVSGDDYVLEDLGSKNGTWVNCARVINSVALSNGDSISFGDQRFFFHLLDAKTLTTPVPRFPTALAVVLFTDIENSTGIRRRLGDAKAHQLLQVHNGVVREALATCGGSEIKHTGDGIMASFPTASAALACSVAIQRGIARHLERHPDMPFGVYVGLNAGEPIAEERDLFGTSVDLAARICEHAEHGQILVSNVVRELAAGKGFLFGDIGEVVPKGFEEPVQLYEVRWRE